MRYWMKLKGIRRNLSTLHGVHVSIQALYINMNIHNNAGAHIQASMDYRHALANHIRLVNLVNDMSATVFSPVMTFFCL